MTTSNAVVDSGKGGAEKHADKQIEKLAEKRRALGRGLESLLPGPRVVPADGRSQVLGLRSQEKTASPEVPDGLAPVAPGATPSLTPQGPADLAAPGTIDWLQASGSASGLTPEGDPIFELAMELIDKNPYQTRLWFDEAALKELADSIAVQGVMQPIVVRPGKEGRFILVLGERRLRASSLLGKTTIRAIVKRASEQQAAEMTLVENLQRQDLNCVDQANAFNNMAKNFSLAQDEIGARVGMSRGKVANYIRVLSLPQSVLGALQQGTLTYSHARVLLQLQNHDQMWRWAQRAIAEKMSVAKLEQLVLGTPVEAKPEKKDGRGRYQDPNVRAAQRSIEEVLGMRVRIRDKNGRGKILIEYATLDDFERVVGMLKGGG
jgi:ParB family transcriptional regulator, chromosome partitioning protein